MSDWACFIFKPAETGCHWLFRLWVTGLASFSSLLKMAVLGSSGGEWLGFVCKPAKMVNLGFQDVSDLGLPFFFSSLLKMVVLGLTSQWVTGLALLSSLLKMVVLGSPVGEWLSLLYFQVAKYGGPWFSRMWVTGLTLFLSLLKMVILGSPVSE